MKHVKSVTRPIPAKAYYYNISLTEKLSEVATLLSIVESAVGVLTGQGL